MQGNKRIKSLDMLRGLAALAVCWYHFVGNRLVGNGLVRSSGKFGWLGVDVFFVISGFVIPYALHVENYRLANYKTFLFKRLLRLYPPYLASLAVSLVILGSYAIYKGNFRLPQDTSSLILHLGLINGIFGKEWLNSIYWTLAIELQFYVAIGLIFPALITKERFARFLAYAILILPLVFLPTQLALFRFIFLFLLGICTFQYSVDLIGELEYKLLIIIFTFGSLMAMGAPVTIVALLTLILINAKTGSPPVFRYLGQVSYSLYLFHGSIGSLVLYFCLRYLVGTSQFEKALGVTIATAITVGVAALSYRFIERPAIECGTALKYSPAKDEEATVVTSSPAFAQGESAGEFHPASHSMG